MCPAFTRGCPVQALKRSRDQPSRKGPTVVSKRYRTVGRPEYDVCVAGGTLGIFIALALQVCWPDVVRCLPCPGQSF